MRSLPRPRRTLTASAVTLSLSATLLLASTARAEGPAANVDQYVLWRESHDRSGDAKPEQLTLINYMFFRATATNMLGDPSGLKGVSLGPIGQIGGSFTRVGDNANGYYVEQRWIPVLQYSPSFVDGLASFRAQMEVDFTWGLAANQVQPNQGGGLNADEVNIQTKNVNVSIYPTRDPEELSIVLGTQAMYDSIYDPATTSLFDIVRTGYKLAFFGTDATGMAVYSKLFGLAKIGLFPFGSAQPDKASKNDPRFSFAGMFTADAAYPIWPGTIVGASYWHLQDDTKGAAYAYEGLVKSGPASTGLGSFTGVPQFNLQEPTGHVEYVGLNFHHNLAFNTSRLAASGFAMFNWGRFTSTKEGAPLKKVDIRGVSANLEVDYKYGRTNGDQITLEGMFTSGDDNPNDKLYTSAFTINNYGLPGAVWFNHKTLLLFPFTSTVNNYTGQVTDISNQGYGLLAGIATASRDLIPNKLNAKIGTAVGESAVNPLPNADGTTRGRFLGWEINAELKYTIRYLMTVGLHGGYLFKGSPAGGFKGSFHNGNPQVTADPWAAFTTFTWYAF
ncbi:MAG: hypothetical protein U0441_37370 [Polyangiaceae bacterium]